MLTLLDLSKHVSKDFLLDIQDQKLEEIAQSEKKKKEKEQRKSNKLNEKKLNLTFYTHLNCVLNHSKFC